jgi:hypothetical protein
MSVSSLLVAALPIPVTAFSLIQTYKAQAKPLSVYTSLFCFLILGFIFFGRHALGRVWLHSGQGVSVTSSFNLMGMLGFYVGMLPLVLILGSIAMVFYYQSLLSDSLTVAKAQAVARVQGGQWAAAYLYDMDHAGNRSEEVGLARQFLGQRDVLLFSLENHDYDSAKSIVEREALGKGQVAAVSNHVVKSLNSDEASTDSSSVPRAPRGPNFLNSFAGTLSPTAITNVLDSPLESIPWSMLLMAYYLGIFAFAEGAFVLMALKEYLFDLLHVSDEVLIVGKQAGA